MDIKLKKSSDGTWVIWKRDDQEARVLLRPLSRRAARTVLAGTVDVKSKKPLPNMRRFFEESVEAQIIDWQGIRTYAEDGEEPKECPCSLENKRMLLEFDPFYDFVEAELLKLRPKDTDERADVEKN
ncbi:MAG: hypothetical protein WA666_02285 [Nitrospirota bacterium]